MVRISKIYRLLISALLAFLGFSCGSETESGRMEYGTPSATYKVKGVVVSESDDSPIEGLRAELKSIYYTINTTYTAGDGSFFLSGDEFPHQKLYVALVDVDGEANGSFASMEIEADYTNKTFTGSSGHWYEGEAEIDLGIIKMQPKQPE